MTKRVDTIVAENVAAATRVSVDATSLDAAAKHRGAMLPDKHRCTRRPLVSGENAMGKSAAVRQRRIRTSNDRAALSADGAV